MSTFTRSAWAIACGVLLVTGAASAKDYEIKLVRPPAVGQRYNITADGALIRTMTYKIGENPTTTTNVGYGIHLEGTVEVLAANADGEESKAACTVTKCTRVTADGEAELIPAGRVVTATGGKSDTTFTTDEGELSSDAAEVLRLVLRMGEDDGFNDDKIYGTSDRRAVGEPWPINAEAAAQEGAGDDIKFEPSAITGSLKIQKTETVDGIECVRIGGDTEIKKFVTDAPQNMTFEHGSLKARYSGVYPVDPELGVLSESVSATHLAKLRGKNADGQETVIDSKVQRAIEMKRKFLDR